MVRAEPAVDRQPPEADRDEVDFTWLTGWLRRRGLVKPTPAGEQLTLFDAPGRPRLSWAHPTAPLPAEARIPIRRNVLARGVVVAATVLYIWVFTRLTFRHHDAFGTYAFDFGIYDQGLWLLSNFERPFSTIMGRHLFGDHTSFILLPLVPVFWVFSTPKLLLFVQAAALGVAAIPAFLLAREKIRDEWLAAGLAVAYLFHPAIGWTNIEQFHPDVFEVPLVLAALYFMVKHRWLWFFVCIGAALLVKEDVPLLVLGLGVYIALKHDRRIGLITCGIAVVYFAAALWWILPAFNGVGTLNTWRIPFGGVGGTIRTFFTRPGEFFDYVTEPDRLWYLWQTFVPLGLLPLLTPSFTLIAIGPLASNVLSTFIYQYDIRYHYGTLIVPVLVGATIYTVANAPTMETKRRLVGVAVGAAVVTAYLWGPSPLWREPPPIGDPDYPTWAFVRQALARVPDDAVVSAHYAYVPHLTHRKEIYQFPTPFKAIFWGTRALDGQRLPQADRVEYVVLPTMLDPEPKAVFDSIRPEFTTMWEEGGIAVYRRAAPR